MSIHYCSCSRECQVAHWKGGHKSACVLLTSSAAPVAAEEK